MSSKKIQGITIEFEGDTSGLGKALKTVDGQTKKLDGELRQIDRLLKFDNANPELLAQKMQVLGNSVQQTENRLDALRQAQSEVQRQFEAGEIGEEQYRKFQREIVATENKLKSLRQQQERVSQKIDMNVDASGLDKVTGKLKEIANQAKDTGKAVGDSIGKGASVAAKGVVGLGVAAGGAALGLGAFVESQKEMNMDLARLATNAEQAGMDLGQVEEGFIKVASISGEADSAVETMSNLLATDFNEAQLAESLDYINGAAVKFSDTLKTEGIADGLQETFATGTAVGQFGELLERSGVDLDKFNAGLATASANGTETDYVLQQLSKLGLKEAYDSYVQTNEGLIKYNEEQGKLQIKTAELAQEMMPLVATFFELGNIILDMVLGNTSLTDGFNRLITVITNLGQSIVTAGKEMIPKFVEGAKSMIPRMLELGIEMIGKIITGIGEALPKVIQSASKMILSFADAMIAKFPNLLETGKNALIALINGITASLPLLLQLSLSLILKFAANLIANLPKIINAGIQIIVALVNGLLKALPKMASFIIGTMIPQIVAIFKKTDWSGIGKDIIRGLIKGIGSMTKNAVEAISGVVDSVTKTAKKLLGIHSPSRVFKQIGLWTGEGMAIGLDDSSAVVNKSMEGIGNGIIDISKKYQAELLKLEKDAGSKRSKETDVLLKKIKAIETKAKKDKRKLTKDENAQIEKLEKQYRDGKLKADTEFNKKYMELVKKSDKEYLEVVKKTIEDKKSLDELSLIDEAKIWEQSLELFVEGSTERITAQKEHQKAVHALNKETVALQTQITNEMLQLDKDLVKGIEEINKEYTQAVESRYQSLMKSHGLFDEFKVEMKATGLELMANLRSQLDGMRNWKSEFDKLANRGLSSDLLDELRDMGVKALPELLALNELTDEQLGIYNNLYEEKSKTAREIAVNELEQMKIDSEKKIAELTAQSKKQLDELNKQWLQSTRELTDATAQEMLTMEQIGLNAGLGLSKGLKQMESPLKQQARQMAETITRTIQEALDIHSPSRVMKGFGINIGQGLIIGMEDMVKGVANTSNLLSGAVVGAQQAMINGVNKVNANKLATQTINQTTNLNGMDGLIDLLTQFVQGQKEPQLYLDGKEISSNTSKYQYAVVGQTAMRKGVNTR